MICADDRKLVLPEEAERFGAANPYATAMRRKNRADAIGYQALLYRVTHDGQVAEAINSLGGRNPEGALAILKELHDRVT